MRPKEQSKAFQCRLKPYLFSNNYLGQAVCSITLAPRLEALVRWVGLFRTICFVTLTRFTRKDFAPRNRRKIHVKQSQAQPEKILWNISRTEKM